MAGFHQPHQSVPLGSTAPVDRMGTAGPRSSRPEPRHRTRRPPVSWTRNALGLPTAVSSYPVPPVWPRRPPSKGMWHQGQSAFRTSAITRGVGARRATTQPTPSLGRPAARAGGRGCTRLLPVNPMTAAPPAMPRVRRSVCWDCCRTGHAGKGSGTTARAWSGLRDAASHRGCAQALVWRAVAAECRSTGRHRAAACREGAGSRRYRDVVIKRPVKTISRSRDTHICLVPGCSQPVQAAVIAHKRDPAA